MRHAIQNYLEDLAVGMEASHSKTVTETDLEVFADLSGDNNPVHMDEAFAATTPFRSRIVHGMLTASLISTILGTKLPGPGAVYVSQSLRFRAPVRLGDTVVARATVSEIDLDRKRARLACCCMVGETVVLDGEALVMVPSR